MFIHYYQSLLLKPDFSIINQIIIKVSIHSNVKLINTHQNKQLHLHNMQLGAPPPPIFVITTNT